MLVNVPQNKICSFGVYPKHSLRHEILIHIRLLISLYSLFINRDIIFQGEGERIKRMKGIWRKVVEVSVEVDEEKGVVECQMALHGLEEGVEVGWVLEHFKVKTKIPIRNSLALSRRGTILALMILPIKRMVSERSFS